MSRKMKDSGVEWIGEIPRDWKMIKTKNKYVNMKKIVGDDVDEYERLSLTLNGVLKRSKEDANGLQPEKFEGYQILRKGEIVFKLIDLENVNTSRVGLSQYTGLVSPAYITLNNPKESRYGYYYFLSMWHRDIFKKLGGDGVRSALNKSDLLNIPYIDVPINEQEKIAIFLDSIVTQIDSIIERTKETINDYKSLKQSIITEAVTKGLNKDVEMKDSGVEWIGEIPKSWKICSIGTLFSSVLGKMVCDSPKGNTYTLEKYLSAINVHFDGVNLNVEKHMWFNPKEKESYLLRKGDLLVVEGGAGAGGTSLFEYEGEDEYYIQNSIHLVRPKSDANSKFLYYWLYSLVNRGYIEYCSNKATIPHFTKDKLLNSPMCFVERDEQEAIVQWLDERCIDIDSLITQKQKLIEDMETYKKSLIYECVTGKKEII